MVFSDTSTMKSKASKLSHMYMYMYPSLSPVGYNRGFMRSRHGLKMLPTARTGPIA